MKKRKFADGGSTPADEIEKNEDGSSKKPRFDEGTYARARAWQAKQMAGESDEKPAKPTPKPTAKPAPSPVAALKSEAAPAPSPAPSKAPAAASGRAEIPVGNEKAPPKDDSYQPGEVGRNVLNSLSALAPGMGKGAGAGMSALKALRATRGAKDAAKSTELAESFTPVTRIPNRSPSTVAKQIGAAPKRLGNTPAKLTSSGGGNPSARDMAAAAMKEGKRRADADLVAKAARVPKERARLQAARKSRDRAEMEEGIHDVAPYRKGGMVRGMGKAMRGCGKGGMK